LTISNQEVLGNIDSETPLYVNYEELWSNLLNPSFFKLASWGYPWCEFSFGKDMVDKLHGVVYDKIMDSIIQMIDKLDLRCTLSNSEDDGSEFVPSDMISHIKPTNPKDFELYLNLIEFCQLFLLKSNPSHLLRWLYVFCKQSCDKALKYPFASGFYKLLTIAMKICKDYKYFEGISEDKMLLDENSSNDDSGVSMITKYSCFHLISKFLKESIERLTEYKNELLISCLSFILSVPKEFIDMKRHSIALKTCFETGISHLPLADLGLNTLNYWFDEIDSLEVKKCLPIIATSMSDYLKVKGNEEKEENTRSSSIRKKTIKVYHNINKKSEIEITLKSIQIRIVQFFGKLGGESLIFLEESENNEKFMSWDTEPHLKFPMPFRDVKPDVFLGKI
jgi:DNA-dependent protein kinase catalytic subunit